MRMHKKHSSYVLMCHKKAAIFLKQQDHMNPHVPKNYPLHLIRICEKLVSIFNCPLQKCYHKETRDLSEHYKICNLKVTNGVVWVGVGGVTV